MCPQGILELVERQDDLWTEDRPREIVDSPTQGSTRQATGVGV